MGQSDRVSIELKEREQKRKAIGLSPHRPTAKAVVHSPPDAKRGNPLPFVILVVLVAMAAAILYLRQSVFAQWPLRFQAPAPMEAGRLIEKYDFAEPHIDLPIGSNEASQLGYVGDLYQMQVTQPGSVVWATLNRPGLRAYRLEADLRLGSQEQFARGYGGLIVRYQNDENFYLFAVDGEGQYQIKLVKQGAWHTVQPWAKSNTISSGRQKVLSVADDGDELRMFIDDVQVDLVADPSLPVGDVGFAVGAPPQAQARGMFDWVALYEMSLAE